MQIKWSDLSKSDLRAILAYVGSSFGRRKSEEVLACIRERVELLRDFPKQGRVFEKDPEMGITYRSITTKMNKIVYYVEDDTIIIVTVWQNRQNINRLKKLLTDNKTNRNM